MLFKVGDQIFDPRETPCAVIFRDDEELQRCAADLVATVPSPGDRWFAQTPQNHFATRQAFLEWATVPTTHIEALTVASGHKPQTFGE